MIFPRTMHDLKDLIKDTITAIGDDPTRPGLIGTPHRVIESWKEMFSGYSWTPKAIKKMMTVFDEQHGDEMIVLSGIEFMSFCEHHLLPFTGYAHVAYIPHGGRIVGISKLARLVDIYSKRLQIQENMTSMIAHTIKECLNPLGSAVVVQAKHFCMCGRGVKKQNSTMTTSSMLGAFRKNPEARAEFFACVHNA